MNDAPTQKREVQQAGVREVLKSYWKTLKEHPYLLSGVIFGMLLLQAANLAAPLFLRQFFNLLAAGSRTDEAVHALVVTLMLVGGSWMLDWLARRIQDLSNQHLEAKVMTKLYDRTFTYMMGHSHNFFASRFAGSLTHRVSRFVRSFEVLFDSFMQNVIPTTIFVVGAIIILYLRHHTLGIALLIWTILFVWFQIYVSLKRQPLRAARSEAESKNTGALADAISNHDTVTLFSGGVYERTHFAGFVDTWRKATLRAWRSDYVTWGIVGLFVILFEVFLLYVAIFFWQKGALTLGDFVLIQWYLLSVFDRLVSINRDLRRFYDAFADAGEMVHMLQMPHEVADIQHAPKLSANEGAIEFKHVDYHFNENQPLFSDFNLAIKPGEKIAFVGSSGAGKSTLIRLILRLYDVKGGAISIDGQNIKEVTQDSLRENLSFVPQEPILFHRSLKENIRYGKRDATDEEIIEAAKKAHCHEFITSFPGGYDTFVGERGIKLSGGERQRVAIARAILKNAPILLLDEATSSLDSESEHLIQDALANLMKNKTVIVIAHRLSTIMKMDRIVVVQNGKIAAEGTHTELLKQDGLYKKLWSIQAGGFINDVGESDKEINLEEVAEEEKELEEKKDIEEVEEKTTENLQR